MALTLVRSSAVICFGYSELKQRGGNLSSSHYGGWGLRKACFLAPSRTMTRSASSVPDRTSQVFAGAIRTVRTWPVEKVPRSTSTAGAKLCALAHLQASMAILQ